MVSCFGNSSHGEDGFVVERGIRGHDLIKEYLNCDILSDFLEFFLSWSSSFVPTWVVFIPVIVRLDEEPLGSIQVIDGMDAIGFSLNNGSFIGLSPWDDVVDRGRQNSVGECISGIGEVLLEDENLSEHPGGRFLLFDNNIIEDARESLAVSGDKSGILIDGEFFILNSGQDRYKADYCINSADFLLSDVEIDDGHQFRDIVIAGEIHISPVKNLVLGISYHDSRAPHRELVDELKEHHLREISIESSGYSLNLFNHLLESIIVFGPISKCLEEKGLSWYFIQVRVNECVKAIERFLVGLGNFNPSLVGWEIELESERRGVLSDGIFMGFHLRVGNTQEE